jgi:hypothetical protein
MPRLATDDPIVQALLAEAEGHESLARAARLRAAAATADPTADDEHLDVKQTHAEYGVARDGLKNAADRGELAITLGARGKLLVRRSELVRWLDSRPYRSKRKVAPAENDFDAIDAELQRGGLVRGAG